MLPFWIRSQYPARSLGTRIIVFFRVCQLVFPEEWVCQAQPLSALSPVLDRLHEMAEGVTTRCI